MTSLQVDLVFVGTDPYKRHSRLPSRGKKQSLSARSRSLSRGRTEQTRSRSHSRDTRKHDVTLLPYTDDVARGEYEPTAFAGEHVTEVQQQNETLRRKV